MSTFNYIGNTDTLYLLNKIKAVLDGTNSLGPGYVTKVTGKQLSTEDFTSALLSKLNGIATGATATAATAQLQSGTKVATITINGTDVDIYIPNAATVDTAMSDSSTNPVQNNTIKAYVDAAVASVTSIEFRVVQTLPASGENGVIYLVPNGGSGTNTKDEYVWIPGSGGASGTWEKIGTTDVDLSGYVQTTDLVEVSTSDIDTMFTTVFGS
ncbi:MAG: hypothetical protein J6Y02_16435 [Pseudobutyrivibrio sp.]|nr:hypothetical protein [Pseudobutyrivibrio sp.]